MIRRLAPAAALVGLALAAQAASAGPIPNPICQQLPVTGRTCVHHPIQDPPAPNKSKTPAEQGDTPDYGYCVETGCVGVSTENDPVKP